MKSKAKKICSFLLPGLLGAAILVGVTNALLKDETRTLVNAFTPGEVTTRIEEETVINGSKILKTPCVENMGPNDCIVRMRVNISPRAAAEYLDADKVKYQTQAWSYKEQDGFWYYNQVLPYSEGGRVLEEAQRRTLPLFTEITGVIGDDGRILKKLKGWEEFQITLYQESVQAVVYDGQGTRYAAFDREGRYQQELADVIWKLYDQGKLSETQEGR